VTCCPASTTKQAAPERGPGGLERGKLTFGTSGAILGSKQAIGKLGLAPAGLFAEFGFAPEAKYGSVTRYALALA
jgi:hypothetical protein